MGDEADGGLSGGVYGNGRKRKEKTSGKKSAEASDL